MTYTPRAGFGTRLYYGDGGAAAVTATLTHSTSNQQMLFTAVAGGTAGNSVSVEIINNATLSVSVAASKITINADTSAHSVNDVISAFYASAAARALADVTDGAGDGSGLVVALSETNLSGGTDSAEVFTEIKGLTSLTPPGGTREEIDVTNHSSPGGAMETIPEKVYDPGAVTGDLLYDPNDSAHQQLEALFYSTDRINWQIRFSDEIGITKQFVGWVKNLGQPQAGTRGALTRPLEVRITGVVSDV